MFYIFTVCFSVLLSLFLLLANIFSWTPIWAFMKVFTKNNFLNIYIIYSLIVINSLIYLIIKIKKEMLKAMIPFCLNLLTILLLLFIPFRNIGLQIDIQNNFEAKNEIIKKIKSGILIPDDKGKIQLPLLSKHLSKDGGEVLVENKNNKLKVFFFTFRGVLDNFSGLLYTSDNQKPENGIFGTDIKEIKKEQDYWYWLVSS